MPRLPTDTRNRLVTAASEAFHDLGYAKASLADIAERAQVPRGSVFYHFRTKEDLAHAVVEDWCGWLEELLSEIDAEPNPWLRLDAFVDQATLGQQEYAAKGCPLAGLARDLRHEAPELQSVVPRPYELQRCWLITQFEALGFRTGPARDHAEALLARYNGALLLAHAHGGPGPIELTVAGLKRWLAMLGRAPQDHGIGGSGCA